MIPQWMAHDPFIVRDFEQWAAMQGMGRLGLGDAGLHRASERISTAVWDRKVKAQTIKDKYLIERRAELRIKYKQLLESGEIREMTPTERLQHAANGHPDNEATQAAKRLLVKRAVIQTKGLKGGIQ
jgi:hypothetical protein